jgi:hypothetical protein
MHKKGAHIGVTDELAAAFLGRGAHAVAVEHIATLEQRLKLRGATEQKIFVSGRITRVLDVMHGFEMGTTRQKLLRCICETFS